MRNRKSIRLKGYDYASQGEYFVTICTKNKACLFGKIFDGKMVLNDCGGIVQRCLLDIHNRHKCCRIDEYVIMPNHIHVIFEIYEFVGAGLAPAQLYSRATAQPFGGQARVAKNTRATAQPFGRQARVAKSKRATARVARTGLDQIVGGFKSICVVEYNNYLKNHNICKSCLLWQRNYYEHIIRDETAYENIKNYIRDNPINWMSDKLNK